MVPPDFSSKLTATESAPHTKSTHIHNMWIWIWIWGPCRAFWSLPLSEYLMLYSPASSRGKKFPQIEFGIQWLLPAFRINVTISLNLAANYNLGEKLNLSLLKVCPKVSILFLQMYSKGDLVLCKRSNASSTFSCFILDFFKRVVFNTKSYILVMARSLQTSIYFPFE